MLFMRPAVPLFISCDAFLLFCPGGFRDSAEPTALRGGDWGGVKRDRIQTESTVQSVHDRSRWTRQLGWARNR